MNPLPAAWLTLLLAAAPVADDRDAPLDLTPAPQVDERLFLLYVVADLHRSWPAADAAGAGLADWLTSQRRLLAQLQARVRTARLDPELAELLQETAGLVDVCEQFLVDAGTIERRVQGIANQDHFQTGYGFGSDAVRYYSQARDGGATKDDAVGVAVLVSGVRALIDGVQRQRQRDAAQEQAMAQAARRVRNASEAAQARAAAIARELTGRHGWAVGEAGLDGFAARNLGEHIRRRPRDPFPRLANAAIRVAGETANDLVRDANAAVAAVRLVPADAAYEGFRARGLVLASALAADACSKEWFEDARHAYPTASAAAMVRIVRTRLRHPDPTHAGQYELARALNLAGRHGEALNAASAATRLHGTPGFAYDYTCLLSLDGQTRLALDWLRFAMARGYGNVQWARQDPDLERLRREQASGFADLTQVKFRWQIVWGVFNDDIRVTNDSAFALTNVTLSPDIRQGARTWNPPLRVARLEPGASHTWSNVVAIPGRRTDVARASLTADQTPR